MWTFDWVGQALAARSDPFYTQQIFYPAGISLASHNIAWLNIALWLPLRPLVGPIAAYNLVLLLIYLFNCLASYHFALELGLRRTSAFLAGAIAGFWPYLISHYDHPNMIMIGWVPLCLLHLSRFWRTGRLQAAVLTGLALVLFGSGRWQLLIMGGFLMLPYALYLLWQHRPVSLRQRWQGLLLITVIAILGLLPILLPLLLNFSGGASIDEVLFSQRDGQTDLLAYLLPSRYHPLWGDWARQTATFASFRYNTLYIPALLYSTLPLVLWGWWRRRPQSHLWLALALLLIVLALGPILRVGGVLYENLPMPYDWIDEFVLIHVLRRSDRLNILLGLPLGLLAALGWQALFGSGRFRLWGYLWIGLILFEALPTPFPTTDTRITPAWYETLATEPGDFAILDLPFSRIPQKLSMYYQLTHGKPLATGKIARVPKAAYDFLDSIPIWAELRSSGIVNPAYLAISQQLQPLATNNIRYVVLHKTGLDNGQSKAMAVWLPYQPRYEDELLAVYSTAPQLGTDYELRAPLDPAVGLVAATRTSDGSQWDLVWTALATPSALDLCLKPLPPAELSGWQCTPLSPDVPPSSWLPGDLVRQTIPLLAETVQLALAPAGTQPGSDAVYVSLP